MSLVYHFISDNKSKKVLIFSFTLIVVTLLTQSISNQFSFAQNASNTNQSSAQVNLDEQTKKLESSNDPKDIATLAYIWGYPLVLTNRAVDFGTNPNTLPGPGRGPLNTLSHIRDLINANFTDVVNPNVDTLYSRALIRLDDGALVLKVPSLADRYYTLQFMDAYTNNFKFIGSRTNVTSGGTYIITGPNWNGKIPSGMTEIKSPTNTMWLLLRILVNGPQDVNTVRGLQDGFDLSPLIHQTANNNTTASANQSSSSVPVSPMPTAIPTTGVKIFDEIGNDMISNPPYSYDADLNAKFKSIGIGPGLKPSETKNVTIINALEQGIVQGEKLIAEKAAHSSNLVNGWSLNLNSGNFGNDYLLRAAVAKISIAQNSAEEALYQKAFVDNNGNALTGTKKYVIHFDKDKFPPVNAFWSITMYDSKAYFVDNPLNRYAIGDRTPGMKVNTDGSLDIYIQHENPGKDKETNWLPAPSDDFNLMMRMYNPKVVVLNGEYQIPPVQKVG